MTKPKIFVQIFQPKIEGCPDSHFYNGKIAEVINNLTGKKALVYSDNEKFEILIANQDLGYEFTTGETCHSYDEAIQRAKELTQPEIYSIRKFAHKIRDHFQRFIKAETPESKQYNKRWAGEFEILDRAKSSYPYRYWLIHYGKPVLQIKIYNLDTGDLRPFLIKEGLINSRSDQRGINACLIAFGIETIVYSREKTKLIKC